MNQYNVIGVMSGSSLDGLDLCYASITQESSWSYKINNCETVPIPEFLKSRLSQSDSCNGYELMILDIDYGNWVANQIKAFVGKLKSIDIIGFHGHTVFHEPQKQLSLQIGRGSVISSITGLPVVDDFRTKDILEGGQGAPLVPFGDVSLFSEYNAWVNLGGIANITVKQGETIQAWDLAPCNQVLNYFSRQLGKVYDEEGRLAQTGNIDQEWMDLLRSLPYISEKPPKSMSNQWITENILKGRLPKPKDGLYTFVEFLANEFAKTTGEYLHVGGQVLFTGGGTHNTYLMKQIIDQLLELEIEVVIPDTQLINFKEALIFGFLGLLRKLGVPNSLHFSRKGKDGGLLGVLHLP